MTSLDRTNSENKDFRKLVFELDKDLAIRNGDSNDFFAQFNKIDLLNNVVIAYVDFSPAGCGAIKEFNNFTMEIKRMYVRNEMRRKGVAIDILNNLENWARELGYKKCVLETGDQMIEAIGLYRKNGYRVIPNYGQYENIESSICFEKDLILTL